MDLEPPQVARLRRASQCRIGPVLINAVVLTNVAAEISMSALP